MPEGGTLSVSSRLAEDGRLAISFADTGHGIDPEHLEHIFEPFFSTKEEGTGLGLSVSYNVVQRHGGEITFQSKVGEGTTFTVWLPALSE
jgi:two-component system NtrC family sensor kinase